MPRLRNTRQEKFARGIAALDPLATAYREAGYEGDPKWHPFNASRLANKPAVKARIDELRTEFERHSAIKADYVRLKLLELIEADVRELYEPDPSGKGLRLRPMSEWPVRLSRAVSRIRLDPETGAPIEVVLAGKGEAAGTLLRSLPGGAIQRNEHTGPDGAPIINIRQISYLEEAAELQSASAQAADPAAAPGAPVVNVVKYTTASED